MKALVRKQYLSSKHRSAAGPFKKSVKRARPSSAPSSVCSSEKASSSLRVLRAELSLRQSCLGTGHPATVAISERIQEAIEEAAAVAALSQVPTPKAEVAAVTEVAAENEVVHEEPAAMVVLPEPFDYRVGIVTPADMLLPGADDDDDDDDELVLDYGGKGGKGDNNDDGGDYVSGNSDSLQSHDVDRSSNDSSSSSRSNAVSWPIGPSKVYGGTKRKASQTSFDSTESSMDYSVAPATPPTQSAGINGASDENTPRISNAVQRPLNSQQEIELERQAEYFKALDREYQFSIC